jgi:transcriptional regulator with XRE-family HTH domain
MFKGDRLRELRDEKKMTQGDLGILINVKPSAINRYENGKREPDSDKLDFFSKYFNVTTDYLLGCTEDKKIFIKENLNLIRGKMSYEELSIDIGVKLEDPYLSDSFNVEYLQGIFEGTIIPTPVRVYSLASYAQVYEEFFYRNNTSINDLIAAQEEFKKNKKLIDPAPKPCYISTPFDDDLNSFISDKDNRIYIEFAKKLKEKGINPNDIISYIMKA